MRIFKSHPLLSLVNGYLVDSPQPSNISYLWNFGFLLGFCLITIQIITGVTLAMHYNPSGLASVLEAFNSVQGIIVNINNGLLTRSLCLNIASAFFFLVYLHIGKNLYYGSYRAPRTLVWTIGTVIFNLMMATALLKYALPYGQVSLWGITVITTSFLLSLGVIALVLFLFMYSMLYLIRSTLLSNRIGQIMSFSIIWTILMDHDNMYSPIVAIARFCLLFLFLNICNYLLYGRYLTLRKFIWSLLLTLFALVVGWILIAPMATWFICYFCPEFNKFILNSLGWSLFSHINNVVWHDMIPIRYYTDFFNKIMYSHDEFYARNPKDRPMCVKDVEGFTPIVRSGFEQPRPDDGVLLYNIVNTVEPGVRHVNKPIYPDTVLFNGCWSETIHMSRLRQVALLFRYKL